MTLELRRAGVTCCVWGRCWIVLFSLGLLVAVASYFATILYGNGTARMHKRARGQQHASTHSTATKTTRQARGEGRPGRGDGPGDMTGMERPHAHPNRPLG